METLARTSDPVTSKQAAQQVTKRTPHMMRLLAEFAKKSQSAEEAAAKAGLLGIGYWKRVSDLKTAGLITARMDPKTGKPMTTLSSSYRRVQVWRITQYGRALLREFRAEQRAKKAA